MQLDSELPYIVALSSTTNFTDMFGSAYRGKMRGLSAGRRTFKGPFRFLDLPPELRNRVYSYAVFLQSRDIGYFRIPPVAQVSKQTRKESLPILFAENNFCCRVGCEWVPYFKRAPYGFPIVAKTSSAGVISMSRSMERLFIAIGDEAALFRDVTLDVFDADCTELVRLNQVHRKRFEFERAVARLRLRAGQQGPLEVSVEELQQHPRQNRRRTGPVVEGRDVDKAVERAVQVGRDLAARDGFKGFSLGDLKAVALALRVP
ncbi:hypothetical protein PRZ48_004615 [Zasmidium cellare]|uniref:Uncharacterized protein n=1 Tax=Zasmidium cellare TaxID=395010 RepID=A0ABR0ERC5_ZASCE|nr:hypothetical protein PRZ48_004615 [Zasmidium cellare]